MEDTTTNNNNKPIKDQQLQAVRFAAGVAVVIACLERAAVLSIFRQWHVWVFLALNLLLIAILFTSANPPPDPSNPPPKSDSGQETAGNCKTPPSTAAEGEGEEVGGGGGVGGDGLKMGVGLEREEVGFEGEEEEERDGGGDEGLAAAAAEVMTDEELNERVEAFISRFRQQYLVSDVKVISSRNGVFSKTITV